MSLATFQSSTSNLLGACYDIASYSGILSPLSGYFLVDLSFFFLTSHFWLLFSLKKKKQINNNAQNSFHISGCRFFDACLRVRTTLSRALTMPAFIRFQKAVGLSLLFSMVLSANRILSECAPLLVCEEYRG